MTKRNLSTFLLVCLLGLGTLLSANNNAEAKAESGAISAGIFNETGYPIVSEPVTLKVAARKRNEITKPFEELDVYKLLEDKTNVKIEWEVTPLASWQEKKSLIIASGDWPDVFYGNYIFQNGEVTRYAADGVIIPLEGLIDKYAPNIKRIFEEYPEYKKYVTAPDGHIYSLPVIDANFPSAMGAQFINKKWLDEVGMDIPTTTEELFDVLEAFKGRLEDGETPYSFQYENNVWGQNGMFGSFGIADNTDHLTKIDGKVIYTPIQPEYKEAVKYFHRLLEADLIDVESFSQNGGVLKSKIKNKQVGLWQGWSRSVLFGADYENSDYVFMPPVKGPNGDNKYFWKPSSAMSGKGSFMITATCENPEVAMRWADAQVEPEMSFQVCHGLLGYRYEKQADGTYVELPIPDGMNGNQFRHATTAGGNSFNMVPASFLENVVPNSGIAEKNSYEAAYAATNSNTPLAPYYLLPELSARNAEIMSDIGPYARETTAKWMLNGGIDEEWDAFVAKVKEMGIEELVANIQARHDEMEGK